MSPRPSGLSRRETLILAAFVLLIGLLLATQKAYQWGEKAALDRPAPGASSDAVPRPVIEPGFDVIRVTRDGNAVLAGRAAPGAEVVLKSANRVVGKTTADKRGDWVLLLEEPLPPGSQVLTLTTRSADGPLLSRESAVISVPERPDGEVFVAISRDGKATRILDQGGQVAAPDGVAVAGIDLAAGGGAILSGRADPGQRVRLYLDNTPMGEVVADAKGDWELHLTEKLAPGQHHLRADQLGDDDRVALRAEVAFTRAETGGLTIGDRQVVVQQGNALWEIARNIYGEGTAYSVIFTGNKEQIRDPDLIYPGQVFNIPAPPSDASSDAGPRTSNAVP